LIVHVGAHAAVARSVEPRVANVACRTFPLVTALAHATAFSAAHVGGVAVAVGGVSARAHAVRVPLVASDAAAAVGGSVDKLRALLATKAVPAVTACAVATQKSVPGNPGCMVGAVVHRRASEAASGVHPVETRSACSAVARSVEVWRAQAAVGTCPLFFAGALATVVQVSSDVRGIIAAIKSVRAQTRAVGPRGHTRVTCSASVAITATKLLLARLARVAGPAVAAFARAAGVHVAGHARRVAVAVLGRVARPVAVRIRFVSVHAPGAVQRGVERVGALIASSTRPFVPAIARARADEA